MMTLMHLPRRNNASIPQHIEWLAVVVFCSLLALPSQAKVYKWVAEDGSISFSDTPQPGAEEVVVKDIPTVNLNSDQPLNQLLQQQNSVIKPKPSNMIAPQTNVVSNYVSALIASPKQDETIQTGQSGNFTVMLKSEPALLPGHKIQLIINGKPYGAPVAKSFIPLRNMNRGAHQIQAQILSKDNTPLIYTNTVTVHVKRAIAIRPQ